MPQDKWNLLKFLAAVVAIQLLARSGAHADANLCSLDFVQISNDGRKIENLQSDIIPSEEKTPDGRRLVKLKRKPTLVNRLLGPSLGEIEFNSAGVAQHYSLYRLGEFGLNENLRYTFDYSQQKCFIRTVSEGDSERFQGPNLQLVDADVRLCAELNQVIEARKLCDETVAKQIQSIREKYPNVRPIYGIGFNSPTAAVATAGAYIDRCHEDRFLKRSFKAMIGDAQSNSKQSKPDSAGKSAF